MSLTQQAHNARPNKSARVDWVSAEEKSYNPRELLFIFHFGIIISEGDDKCGTNQLPYISFEDTVTGAHNQ